MGALSTPPMTAMTANTPNMIKTNSAKGNEVDMATIGTRPLRLQDMLKTAMAESASKVNVSLEAARLADETGEPVEKRASADGVDHEYALKLASAVEFIVKEGEFGHSEKTGPGAGPNALKTLTPTHTEPMKHDPGHGHNIVPMVTGTQRGPGPHTAQTQVPNDADRAPGGPGHQTTAMTAGKGKTASAKDIRAAFTKVADNGTDDAVISGRGDTTPGFSASGQPGGAPLGGKPKGPTHLIESTQAAINYKPNTAHDPRKAELKEYFNEPALTSSTDKTLQNAFEHTGVSGAKISSVQVGTGTKVAAARAVLAKLAEETKGA